MLLTATQVAEKLNVTPSTVRKMCDEKRIPATNIAKPGAERAAWRIDEKDLRAFRAAARNGHDKGTIAPTESDAVPTGYVTSRVASERSGLTQSGILWRVSRGKLAAVKVNGLTYVPLKDIAPKYKAALPDFIAPVAAGSGKSYVAEPNAPRSIPALLRELIERTARVENKMDELLRMWSA